MTALQKIERYAVQPGEYYLADDGCIFAIDGLLDDSEEHVQSLLGSIINAANLNGIELRTVLDLGAHAGLFTVRMSKAGMFVVAVEANPWAFHAMMGNLFQNDCLNRVRPICAAVSGHRQGLCEVRSPVCNAPMAGLNGPPQWPVVGHSAAVRLEEILKLCRFDLIKCDIESEEHSVFASLPPNALEGVKLLAVEIHDAVEGWRDKSMRIIDVRKTIERLGFEYVQEPGIFVKR